VILATLVALAITVWVVVRTALALIPVRRFEKLLARDRLRMLSHLVDSVLVLALARVFVDWTAATLLPWYGLIAVTAAAAAGAALRWEAIPWLEDGGRAAKRGAGFAASVVVSAAFIGLVAV
jgi:hypothetical protein